MELGKHCSPESTPLPCRASPLKRRRFEKASSLEEVARSAGGVTHHRENNVRPYRVVSHIDSGVWNGQLVTADRCGHLSLQKYHKTETLQNVQNPRPTVGANIVRPGCLLFRGGGTKCRRSDAPPGEQCSPLQNHFTTPHHMKNRRFCSVGCRVSDAGKCAGFSRELPETEIFFEYRVNSRS